MKNVAQFYTLGDLVPRLCRQFRCTQSTEDIEGDSGAALNLSLRLAHTKPSASRGLGCAPDLCQVNGLARINSEIESDCWRFTLKGAKKPDKRPWAAVLTSGDSVKIESAERVAFLDWETPDKGAPEHGRGQSPATRRTWSPPAAKAS